MSIRTGIFEGTLSAVLMLACASCSASADNLDPESVSAGSETDPGAFAEQLLAGCLDTLSSNKYLVSPDGQNRLYMQGDGNLVLRNVSTQKALWASGTDGKGAVKLVLQTDGNLVLYTSSGQPVWATNTVGKGSNALRVNDNGSLVLYAGSTVVWSANGSSSLAANAPANGQLCASGTVVTPPPAPSPAPPPAPSPAPPPASCAYPKNQSGHILSASGCFSWSGRPVRYTSRGAAVFPYGDIIGTVDSPAAYGDWEIVAFGASHGGDTSKEVGTIFNTSTATMATQGFALIGVNGELDKKVELWLREYRKAGKSTIAVPTDAKSYNILVLNGADVRVRSELVAQKTIESSGQPWRVPSTCGSDLNIVAYFGDDSDEVTNTGGGELLFNEWGFGDGDSLNVVLYAPGDTPPSTMTINNHAVGGQQYVGILANFPKW
jgi:hypothetical protein